VSIELFPMHQHQSLLPGPVLRVLFGPSVWQILGLVLAAHTQSGHRGLGAAGRIRRIHRTRRTRRIHRTRAARQGCRGWVARTYTTNLPSAPPHESAATWRAAFSLAVRFWGRRAFPHGPCPPRAAANLAGKVLRSRRGPLSDAWQSMGHRRLAQFASVFRWL
jgi:hypothetical protein